MHMQKLTIIEAMQLLAKTLNSPCMYVSFNDDDEFSEIGRAAPYMDDDNDNDLQIIADGAGIIIFPSEQQMEQTYELTVGDNGPTHENRYNGPARVFALCCGANGILLDSNT